MTIPKIAIRNTKCFFVGDKEEDIIAANNSGINNTIIVRSGHKVDKLNSKLEIENIPMVRIVS